MALALAYATVPGCEDIDDDGDISTMVTTMVEKDGLHTHASL